MIFCAFWYKKKLKNGIVIIFTFFRKITSKYMKKKNIICPICRYRLPLKGPTSSPSPVGKDPSPSITPTLFYSQAAIEPA